MQLQAFLSVFNTSPGMMTADAEAEAAHKGTSSCDEPVDDDPGRTGCLFQDAVVKI